MSVHATFSDAEAVAGSIVRTGVSGSRVYSSIPNSPTYPLIVVRRIGGLPIHRSAYDQAEVQLDVWAESKSEARSLAAQARIALLDSEGTTVTVSGSSSWVSAVEDSLGLTWLPDPGNTTKDRYVFGVRLTLRPA